MAVQDKAVAIAKRHNKQGSLCFRLDTEETKVEGIKFFCYDDGIYCQDAKYICSECRDGIKTVRKMVHAKITNPALDIFKDFVPWVCKTVANPIPWFLLEKKKK